MAEYIEREAAIEEFQTEGARFIYTAGGCRAIISRIRVVPAADVVEVRHERWDLAKDPFGAGYVKCSRCGYKHCPEYYPDGSAIMHLFCPSCGAKMDGGHDE